MGFSINVNNILRSDFGGTLQVGPEYSFEKELSILTDDVQIFLTKKDWTAVGEILITEQTRRDGKTLGKFIVKYLYNELESKALTEVFRRMYGAE